jgi:uncharacterized protein YbcI
VVERLWVFEHVGFFASGGSSRPLAVGGIPMLESNSTMAQQIGEAAIAFEERRTGHAPDSATVVLCENMLVVTLHGSLSPAEKALAKTPDGAAQLQEFHRRLFSSNARSLRMEIQRITGVVVREATAEVETATGSVVQVFTSGDTVQVFLLARGLPTETWSGNVSSDRDE